MDVSGQLHALAALCPGKELLVPNRYWQVSLLVLSTISYWSDETNEGDVGSAYGMYE
jgi:hypothetical protein